MYTHDCMYGYYLQLCMFGCGCMHTHVHATLVHSYAYMYVYMATASSCVGEVVGAGA